MKLLVLSTFLLLCYGTAMAQTGLDIGYTYRIDQRIDKAFREGHGRFYPIHQFSFGVNRLTSKGWEWGVDVTESVNRQQFYAASTYTYLTGGFGPAKHTIETRYRANVSYAYTGARFSVEKWFGLKRGDRMQIGLEVFQHADFLSSYKQTNTERQEYQKHESGWGTTEQLSDWAADDFKALEMREKLLYAGFNLALRFRIAHYWIEPAASIAYGGGTLRSKSEYLEFVSPSWMPAVSCKIGYRFQSKAK